VPPEQISIAEHGAAADGLQPPLPTATPSMSRSPSSASSQLRPPVPSRKSSGSSISARPTKEVALKMIPKRKVKGNEASVWGEMDVLKGLDHPNIVSIVCFGHSFCGTRLLI